MRLVRLLARVVPVAAVAFLVAPAGVGSAPPPASAPAASPSKPFTGADVEVRYSDDSNMKLKLLDEKLELTTRHGVLRIAAAEIRKIEFATRVPTEVAEKVASAIG